MFITVNADYSPWTTENVTIEAGNAITSIQVQTLSDNIGEEDELFRAILTSPSSNARLGVDAAIVKICDTTSVIVEFNSTMYSEKEHQQVINFTIVKINEASRPVLVLFNSYFTRHC